MSEVTENDEIVQGSSGKGYKQGMLCIKVRQVDGSESEHTPWSVTFCKTTVC